MTSIQHSPCSVQGSVWAIVPVKRLHDSKRRLAHLLSAAERADLIDRFLGHTLTVLNQSAGIDHVLVISGDERALATTRFHGAEALLETAVTGLNPAVSQAVKYAKDEGATAVLILPADLPFIQTEDVAIMVGSKTNRSGMVICSDDKNNGTNALLISPPDNFTFHYGLDSFQCHLQEAAQRGLITRTVRVPGLKFDLDTEEDWRKYQLITNNEQLIINY